MSNLPIDSEVLPEVMQSLRHVDKWGEPLLKRLGLFPLLRHVIQAGVPCRTVPEDRWRQATDMENHAQAVIDCMCGATMVVHLGTGPHWCGGCDRAFVYTGPQVMALKASRTQSA